MDILNTELPTLRSHCSSREIRYRSWCRKSLVKRNLLVKLKDVYMREGNSLDTLNTELRTL